MLGTKAAWLAVFGAALILDETAHGATVTGTVTWSEARVFESITPSVDHDVCGVQAPLRGREVVFDPQGAVQGAVVMVPDAGAVRPPETAELTLHRCQFTPRVIALPQGSTVRFVSADPVLYNVTLEGPQGEVLHSATLVAAGQRTPPWPLPGEGRYRVTSRAGHHWINAHIWVLGQGTWTQSDAAGGFVMKGLPGGAHRVVAWHPDLGVCEQHIELAKSGTVSADLRF